MDNYQSADRQVVDLADLVTAPLIAIVEADFLAIRRCLDLIRELCFEHAPQQEGAFTDLGCLRTIRFRAEQPGPGGHSHSVFVQVPLLSLLTLPLIQIQEAEFEMNLHLVDPLVQTVELQASPAKSEGPAGTRDTRGHRRSVPRWQATLAPQNSDPVQRKLAPHLDTHLKLRMKVREADIPAGLSNLLRVAAHGTYAAADLPNPLPPPGEQGA
jgi:hypothetical protein